MIDEEILNTINKYADEIFDISERELRVNFVVGKNFTPEIRVHLQEELPFNSIPHTEYLSNNKEVLIEHLEKLKQALIQNSFEPHLD